MSLFPCHIVSVFLCRSQCLRLCHASLSFPSLSSVTVVVFVPGHIVLLFVVCHSHYPGLCPMSHCLRVCYLSHCLRVCYLSHCLRVLPVTLPSCVTCHIAFVCYLSHCLRVLPVTLPSFSVSSQIAYGCIPCPIALIFVPCHIVRQIS